MPVQPVKIFLGGNRKKCQLPSLLQRDLFQKHLQGQEPKGGTQTMMWMKKIQSPQHPVNLVDPTRKFLN
uniref:Uncharacterized protein n=1 Tax=Cannabis sativa TaxID=3483 RepID=A0A803R8R0_CANSA